MDQHHLSGDEPADTAEDLLYAVEKGHGGAPHVILTGYEAADERLSVGCFALITRLPKTN